MRFFQIHETTMLWAVIRNVPAIVLFVGGVWYWAREKRARSMTLTLVGAVASSLLIRSTNPMASISKEPCEITIVTIVAMSMLQALLVAYLGTEAEWSNWKVDLGLGSMAGITLAVARGLALPGPPWIRIVLHSLALAAVGVLALLVIRKLKERTLPSTLATALLLAVVMTLLARSMGYRFIPE